MKPFQTAKYVHGLDVPQPSRACVGGDMAHPWESEHGPLDVSCDGPQFTTLARDGAVILTDLPNRRAACPETRRPRTEKTP